MWNFCKCVHLLHFIFDHTQHSLINQIFHIAIEKINQIKIYIINLFQSSKRSHIWHLPAGTDLNFKIEMLTHWIFIIYFFFYSFHISRQSIIKHKIVGFWGKYFFSLEIPCKRIWWLLTLTKVTSLININCNNQMFHMIFHH